MDQKDIEAFYKSLEERRIVLDKLKEIQDTVGLNKEDRMRYEASLKVYRDQLVTMEYQWQQGEASGFIKGKAEGLAQGKEEERFNNARGMKAAGISPDLIAQITGLSLETIEGL